MGYEDTVMLSPAPASPTSAAALPAPLQPESLVLSAQAHELTPHTSASISSLVPRQYPQEYEHYTRSWLATQVWKYFDDSGFEVSTAPDVSGYSLREQHKCRCMYCDDVMRATPTEMATHIVSHCRVADPAAKRALRTGKPDPLATLDVARPPRIQPPRLQCLAVASDEQVSAPTSAVALSKDSDKDMDAHARVSAPLCANQRADHEAAVIAHPSVATTKCAAPAPQVLDYVGAFLWEASTIRVRSRLFSTAAAMGCDSPSLEEATRRAEAMILATVSNSSGNAAHPAGELPWLERPTSNAAASFAPERCVSAAKKTRSDRCASVCQSAGTDKENMPPCSEPDSCSNDILASAAKRQRLGRNRRKHPVDSTNGEGFKTHVPSKKRLFAETPVRDERPRASAAASAGDLQALMRGLTVACVTERVPIAFLSSAAFVSAMTSYGGVAESADLLQLSTTAFEALAQPVDALCDAMRTSTSALTFVVKRLSPHSAVIYLIDDAGRSALVSYHHAEPSCETAVWLDAVRRHYLNTSEWSGRPLHVCVAEYPRALQRELFDTIMSSPSPSPSPSPSLLSKPTPLARLVGGCMAHEFALLRTDALPLLRGAPDVVLVCAELALLVNEAERLSSAQGGGGGDSPRAVIELLLLAPRGDQVVSYTVLLKQVLTEKQRIAATYQAARDAPRSCALTRTTHCEILYRTKEILDSVHDQWPVAAETLQLLLPLAVAELLAIRGVAATLPAAKLTSGTFLCLELWLFATLAQSPLCMSSAWREQFVQRQRVTRMNHQLAGLLLDPRIAGAGLSTAGLAAAQQCVLATSQRVWPQLNVARLASQLAEYASKSGVFGRCELWERGSVADPLAFWRSVQHACELQQVALLVCSFAPCSPPTNDHESHLDAAADMNQASRAAQVRHHLQRQEAVRDPAVMTSRTALKLLQFVLTDDVSRSDDDDGSDCDRNLPLLELEQLVWQPSGAHAATQESILSASQVYAATLQSTIEGAEALGRADQVTNARSAAVEASASCSLLLQDFSVTWIDCSHAGLVAMRRAIASLCLAR